MHGILVDWNVVGKKVHAETAWWEARTDMQKEKARLAVHETTVPLAEEAMRVYLCPLT